MRGAPVETIIGHAANVYLFVGQWVESEQERGSMFGTKLFRRRPPVERDTFFQAIERKDLDRIKELLALGADVNRVGYNGRTALYDSALFGNCTCLGELLNRGADVEAVRDGHTVLMAACQECNEKAVRILLEAGADPNRKRGHFVAARLVNREANPEIINVLREFGADIPPELTESTEG